MADRTGRDQTVHPGTHCEAGAAGCAVKVGGFLEDFPVHRGFDDREGEQGLTSSAEGPLVAKTLEHLLDDGQTGRDLLQVRDGFQAEARTSMKDLDPDGGVNEKHVAGSCLRAS